MNSRQLPAASARSASVNSTCTSFSASAKVAGDTSGPTGGAVPNAGGAPGGRSLGFCAWLLPRRLRLTGQGCVGQEFSARFRHVSPNGILQSYQGMDNKTSGVWPAPLPRDYVSIARHSPSIGGSPQRTPWRNRTISSVRRLRLWHEVVCASGRKTECLEGSLPGPAKNVRAGPSTS